MVCWIQKSDTTGSYFSINLIPFDIRFLDQFFFSLKSIPGDVSNKLAEFLKYLMGPDFFLNFRGPNNSFIMKVPTLTISSSVAGDAGKKDVQTAIWPA